MKKLEIDDSRVDTLFKSKFLNVYDMHYCKDSHYYNASRRSKDNLVCLKNNEQFKAMKPDAVSCVVVVEQQEPKLVLCNEFRYPTGQFLLGVPAGLVDEEDLDIISTAQREIYEECGLSVQREDISIINPLLFSSPGMTDESNALVCVKIKNISSLSTKNIQGSELFDGFTLLTQKQAQDILKQGTDQNGIYYSVYTWAALMYFVSGMWQ
ncbi:NUDIX hydrolase [Floccifex sp.]|uniref:NUDIX hydrolase n=1 Tax=Floccifex sp. TaxID=2815810 RepID=UPI0029FEF260|nr:NUDIX domain-containing protein [Floccifex sp.]MDD7282074.1 NUDIX hydrolase [Erysipelotrichaceae bacterium]MDY2958984.1 NUDIX hydrolase [Floccifex sp.]